MRRFRFRVRTLIVAVAAAAVLIAVFVGYWKSEEKRRLAQLAAYYSGSAQRYADMAKAAQVRETFDNQAASHFESLTGVFRQAGGGWASAGVLAAASKSRQDAAEAAKYEAFYRKDAATAQRLIQYAKTLQAKYESAAARPWIHIDPDPEFVE
jgi:tellurite resistance protein